MDTGLTEEQVQNIGKHAERLQVDFDTMASGTTVQLLVHDNLRLRATLERVVKGIK